MIPNGNKAGMRGQGLLLVFVDPTPARARAWRQGFCSGFLVGLAARGVLFVGLLWGLFLVFLVCRVAIRAVQGQ